MATETKVKKAATGMLKQPLTYSEAVTQIGTTGLKRAGPYIREEYLTELQGRRGRAKYREMYSNDVVRRAVRAIKLPMLAASWNVEGAEGLDSWCRAGARAQEGAVWGAAPSGVHRGWSAVIVQAD